MFAGVDMGRRLEVLLPMGIVQPYSRWNDVQTMPAHGAEAILMAMPIRVPKQGAGFGTLTACRRFFFIVTTKYDAQIRLRMFVVGQNRMRKIARFPDLQPAQAGIEVRFAEESHRHNRRHFISLRMILVAQE